MKILHVIPSIAPRYGGPSAAAIGMCRASGARGLDVCLATTNADGNGQLPVVTGRLIPYEGIAAIFFARIGEGFKYSRPLARWLAAHVREFDLVHIHAVFSHSSLAAARACRSHGVPYLVRPLGSLDPWSLGRKAWLKRAILTVEGRAMLHGATALHYTTDDERRLAEQAIGALPSVVVPLGVDDHLLAEEPPGPEERRTLVVAMSRLHPKKNLETLVEAFSLAVAGSSLPSWKLAIAGDGDAEYRSRLLELAAGFGIHARVTLPGWVDGASKSALLNEAALFAVPSHQENFGLGLLEGLAHGVPAIVSRAVNLAPDVERAGAGWITGESVAEVAESLRAAMSDTSGRLRRALAARELARHFGWGRIGARLEDIYTSILEVSKRPEAAGRTLESASLSSGRGR